MNLIDRARRWTDGQDSTPRVSCALASLFPDGIIAYELTGRCREEDISPAEALFVQNATPKRRQEFAAGRLCARASLEALGFSGVPLPVGRDRAPRWPAAVVGSITHTDGFCGAAVTLRQRVSGLGIDAELRGRVPDHLWPEICVEDELRWLDCLPSSRRSEMATVLFSAKESFYKCQHGITGAWLDFTDVCVSIEGNRFEVRLRKPIKGLNNETGPFLGRFEFKSRLALTGIAL